MKLFYLKKCILIFFMLSSFCLMLSLITFYPFDDTYFQFTGNDVVYNILGQVGALSADILFFVFGLVAYFFVGMIFFLSWICFFKNDVLNIFYLSFNILRYILLLFSLCGLIDFFIDDFYYCCSGGIVGSFLRFNVLYIFHDITINFVFLFIIILVISFSKNSNNNFLYEQYLLKVRIGLINVSYLIRITLNICIDWIGGKKTRNNSYRKRFIHIYNIFRKIVYRVIKSGLNFRFRFIRFSFCNFLFKKSQIYNCNNLDNLFSDYVQSYCKYNNNNKYKINDKKKIDRMTGFVSKKNMQCNRKLIKNNCLIKPSGLPINTTVIFKEKEEDKFKNNMNLFPSIDLLSPPPSLKIFSKDDDIIKKQSELLESKLADYHIQVRVVNVLQGPVVTRFELDLAPGVRSSRIYNLSRDLARSLSTYNLRIIEVIPGKPYIGLEIPNQKREIVYLREILDTEKFRSSYGLMLGLGKDVSGVPVFANLLDMPHLLIAGTTGSGKSVGINSIIISILYRASPENVRFIMIDPKMLELSVYNGIPHLAANVVTNIDDVIDLLNWCVGEMERRYKIMASCGARHLKSYNDYVKSGEFNKCEKSNLFSIKCTKNDIDTSDVILKKLPYIIIIIDEFADLIISGGKEVESLIIRLSQKARACGMHLVLATQRPSVNVITGLIKANIPSRIAFAVSSKIDSRTILDQSGAESLLGKGDMLYLGSSSSMPIRVHGAFVSDVEIFSVVTHWKNVFD